MIQDSADRALVEAEVEQIRTLDIEALRKRWRIMFGANPPDGLTKDIIGRMIAYRIQEQAFGGLDRETTKMLDRLRGGEKPVEPGRRLKPGTVLIREYRGERHTVTVAPDGFVWQEATYPNLTTIAKAITGTAWSGPRFFGLRLPNGSAVESEPATASENFKTKPRRGRSSVRASTIVDPLRSNQNG